MKGLVKLLEFKIWQNINKAPEFLIERYQEHQLRALIAKALGTPAYRELWKEFNVSAKDFALDDLKKLPVIDKNFFRSTLLTNFLVIDRVWDASFVRYFCDDLDRPMRYFEDYNFKSRRQFLESCAGDFLSLPEFGPVAEKCPERKGYHIIEQSLILEIVDDSGCPRLNGIPGKVIITYFFNQYMPFVRYDTTKIGTFLPLNCSCGKKLFLPEFKKPQIIKIKNEIFSKYNFDAVFKFYYGLIDCYEISGFEDEIVTLKIKPGRFWDNSLLAELKRQLRNAINNTADIEILISND